MSRLIIDGYNVIGTSHPDMERARQDLIDLLRRYRQVSKHDITVVFDGYHQGAGSERVSVTGGVRVIYSRLRERADDVIKRILSSDPAEWIVVTSDRDIARHAWSSRSVPVSSDAFLEALRKRMRTTLPDNASLLPDERDGFPDDDEYPVPRRGNARRPSRKDRALERVLGKL